MATFHRTAADLSRDADLRRISRRSVWAPRWNANGRQFLGGVKRQIHRQKIEPRWLQLVFTMTWMGLLMTVALPAKESGLNGGRVGKKLGELV